MHFEQSPLIYVNDAPGKGRGVFAKVDIPKGQAIETVPVLFMHANEFTETKKSNVREHYVYYWKEDLVAIALGYGSLYNHSFEPEADYHFDEHSITYIALRDIAPGEEIHINYENDPEDQSPLGFDMI
jgi:SET domain-containing protein